MNKVCEEHNNQATRKGREFLRKPLQTVQKGLEYFI